MDKDKKCDFLVELSHKYCTDNISISKIASVLTNDNNDNIQSFIRMKKTLQIALTPEYNWLFIHIGRQENGVKFLVDMRTDLLVSIKYVIYVTLLFEIQKKLNNNKKICGYVSKFWGYVS